MAATRSAVVTALDQCYPRANDLDALGLSLRAGLRNAKAAKQTEAAATIEMCTQILGRAVTVGASEVQLTCDDKGATLRYLINGVFESELQLPAADPIRDRFKIMARVGVAVRNRPQSGNFRLTLKGKGTSASLSTLPTDAAETIVIKMAGHPAAATGGLQPKSGARSRIVIADDEPITRMLIKRVLERENFEVIEAENGDQAVALITRERPDLVLLDLNMPIMDGYEAIHHLRHNPSLTGLPIIVLTAEDGQTVERRVLTMGADDYMVKPFSPKELVARVKAVLRRSRNLPEKERKDRIVRDGIVIDPQRHDVRVDGDSIVLTATEFRLLHFLAAHPGRVFTRDQLLTRVIGEEAIVIDRNIDVHVRAIRKKLGEQRQLIETIRGVGYRFKD